MTERSVPPIRPWIGMLVGSQRRMGSQDALADAVRAEVDEARRGGIGVFVLPEHLDASPFRMLGAMPLAAALTGCLDARATVVVSTVAGLTDEATLLRDLATVDAVGPSAVGLAVAAGYRRGDFDAAGRDFAQRYERRWRMVEAVRAAGAVPAGWLWCAASTVATAERSRDLGAACYGGPALSVADAAEMVGRTGGCCVLRRDVLVGRDATEVGDGMARYVRPKYEASADWGYRPPSGDGVIAGTATQVARSLDEVATRVRPAGVVVRMCWPDMPAAVGLAQVRSVVGAVLPQLEAFREAS